MSINIKDAESRKAELIMDSGRAQGCGYYLRNVNNNLVFCICMGIALVSLLGAFWVTVPVANGNLISSPVIDFGEKEPGTSIGAVFKAVNHYSEDVYITGLKTSCDCTVPSETIGGKVIKPGRDLDIKITWQTGGRRGRQSTTAVLTYTIGSSDEQEELLTIQATVKGACVVQPDSLVFEEGVSSTQSVTWSAEKDSRRDLKFLDALSTHEAVSLKFDKAAGSEATVVSVHFDSTKWRGNGLDRAEIIFKSSSVLEDVTLPITVKMKEKERSYEQLQK